VPPFGIEVVKNITQNTYTLCIIGCCELPAKILGMKSQNSVERKMQKSITK